MYIEGKEGRTRVLCWPCHIDVIYICVLYVVHVARKQELSPDDPVIYIAYIHYVYILYAHIYVSMPPPVTDPAFAILSFLSSP